MLISLIVMSLLNISRLPCALYSWSSRPPQRHKRLGVKACLGFHGKAAFLAGLCCYQPDHGIRHGSEPGSREEDQMSALGPRLGPRHK